MLVFIQLLMQGIDRNLVRVLLQIPPILCQHFLCLPYSYLFCKGSWEGKEAFLQLPAVTCFHSSLSLITLPSSWHKTDTRSTSVVAMLSWLVYTGDSRAQLHWSVFPSQTQLLLSLPTSSWMIRYENSTRHYNRSQDRLLRRLSLPANSKTAANDSSVHK